LNYYVYYKLEPSRAQALRAMIDSMFRKAEAQFGVRCRWMRRRDDPATYMEVYEGVGDEAAFEAFLDRESPVPGVERKVERFISA
jgi:hypothetical protein